MKAPAIKSINSCRICDSLEIESIFNLAETPPGDIFFRKKREAVSAEKYPLRVAICRDCGYLHLLDVLSPTLSYSNYVYRSSITVGLRAQFESLVDDVIKYFTLPRGSSVVDLGSNDGTMMEVFKARQMVPVGVEPSERLAVASTGKGFDVYNQFFDSECVRMIRESHGPASLITASYMYANIDDLVGFTLNVKELLKRDGVFVIQTGYHPDQFQNFCFDYIYHEHFSYFSVRAIKKLLERCGLEVIHVETNSLKGGSLRVYAKRSDGKWGVDVSVKTMELHETDNQVGLPEKYREFAGVLLRKKKTLLDLLEQVTLEGSAIVGYGASHSTTTLVHHFGLGKYLQYIVDDNKGKVDSYSPGFGLKVKSPNVLYDDRLEYVVILAWQHSVAILARSRELFRLGIKIILPLPTLKILTQYEDI
jgi:hypothetical protein